MAKLRNFDNGDQGAQDVGSKLHKFVTMAMVSGINEAAQNPAHAAVIGSQAVSAAHHVLARCLQPQEAFEGKSPLTAPQVLFAALLSYHACPLEKEYGQSTFEFSPIALSDAMESFQRLTGRPIEDSDINPGIIQAVKEFNSDPEMKADLASRQAAYYREGASLN